MSRPKKKSSAMAKAFELNAAQETNLLDIRDYIETLEKELEEYNELKPIIDKFKSMYSPIPFLSQENPDQETPDNISPKPLIPKRGRKKNNEKPPDEQPKPPPTPENGQETGEPNEQSHE